MNHRKISAFVLALAILVGMTGISPELAFAAPSLSRTCTVENLDSDPLSVGLGLSEPDVVTLEAFLASNQLKPAQEYTMISELSCLDGQNTIRTMVIPFVGADSEHGIQAHIAFWYGKWDDKELKGAIALYENDQNHVYTVQQEAVAIGSREEWGGTLPMRWDEVAGPSPILAPATAVVSTESLLTTCTSTTGTQTAYTLLGFIAFRFHQRKDWCYTGAYWGITVQNIYTWVSDVDPNFYYQGIVGSWDNWNGVVHASFRQGRVDNCIFQYGCIHTDYPSVQVNAMYDGSAWVDLGW